MSLVNILALSINRYRKIFLFVEKEEKEDRVKYTHKKLCVIYSSQEVCYTGWKIAPLNFSPWGCCLKRERGGGNMIIGTNNTGRFCPSGLTSQRYMPQNNKLLIQIDLFNKSCYIKNWKKGIILQRIIIGNWINTYQTVKFISLPHQMQPSEKFTLTNIGGQK